MAGSYRVKDNLTPSEISALVDALNPFYGFGAVLDAANEENGHAWVNLYGSEDHDDEADFDAAPGETKIVGVNAGWARVPATYCGPTLTAADFYAARDAFLAAVEPTKRTK